MEGEEVGAWLGGADEGGLGVDLLREDCPIAQKCTYEKAEEPHGECVCQLEGQWL